MMQQWSERFSWNFHNKALLLEAELVSISGAFEKAESLYISSIKSANDHKFVHEEAMASELAAQFFYERGLQSKSCTFFMHSLECYRKWGAFAVARRVENDMQSKFGTSQLHEPIDGSAASFIFGCETESPKKRHSEREE